jgi:hypothetical protein
MAYARITLENGVVLEVGMNAEHPDALDQCVGRVKELWRETTDEVGEVDP